MRPDSLSLMLVDDNPHFRAAALLCLSKHIGLYVTAIVASGEEALEVFNKRKFDVVLMDLSMPGMGGLEATRQLKSSPQPPKVIVVTLENAPAYQAAACTAGADGFISKEDFSAQIGTMITSLFPAKRE